MNTNILIDFLVYVIEEYKFLENKTTKDTIELFTKYFIFDYVMKHYDILHTMGGRAIADDINKFIENRAK